MANARFRTLFDYPRYRVALVIIRCRRCSHARHIPAGDLADLFGLSTRIKAVERRLVCSGCGRKAARLVPVP